MKIKDILLTISGLYFIVHFYDKFLKKVFCSHKWRYWEAHLHCTQHSGINDTKFVKWKRCEKCDKQQEMNMIPKEWGWKRSNYTLPDDVDTIHFDVDINKGHSIRRETLSDRRNSKLNSILKK